MKRLTDAEEIQRLMRNLEGHYEANIAKEWAIQNGYTSSLSFYGVLTHKETKHSEYRRIEVFSNAPWTERIVELVYRWLHKMKPIEYYTVWIYNGFTDSIRQIGGW